MKIKCVKIISISGTGGGIYVGDPMNGYYRKQEGHLLFSPYHITWQQIQDMIKMKTHYKIELLTEEEYFLESI